ncbi:putative AB hydrolase-1 domain-containing protein [Seiridium cardinale]|uniref:AB hydrolase-1 domain-containing protein n=1 Tax=Seiridium cardinale TaxID=138064 RepID=A0ABR2XAL0_9PEZI
MAAAYDLQPRDWKSSTRARGCTLIKHAAVWAWFSSWSSVMWQASGGDFYRLKRFKSYFTDYSEENKNSFGIGEFASIASDGLDAGNFTGAALAITAETDYIICDGECRDIFEELTSNIFRNAKVFEAYLYPELVTT